MLKFFVIVFCMFSTIKPMNQQERDFVCVDENSLNVLKDHIKNIQKFYHLVLHKKPSNEHRSLQGAGNLELYLKEKQLLIFVASDWQACVMKKCHKKKFEELNQYDREIFFFAEYDFAQLKEFIDKHITCSKYADVVE